jgi:hypothetical protein
MLPGTVVKDTRVSQLHHRDQMAPCFSGTAHTAIEFTVVNKHECNPI